jgi:hypothetical protein
MTFLIKVQAVDLEKQNFLLLVFGVFFLEASKTKPTSIYKKPMSRKKIVYTILGTYTHTHTTTTNAYNAND